jgi:hypothetical protein
MHVDVNIVDGFELDIEKFRKWKPEFDKAAFIDDNYNFSTPLVISGKEQITIKVGQENERWEIYQWLRD